LVLASKVPEGGAGPELAVLPYLGLQRYDRQKDGSHKHGESQMFGGKQMRRIRASVLRRVFGKTLTARYLIEQTLAWQKPILRKLGVRPSKHRDPATRIERNFQRIAEQGRQKRQRDVARQ
jgi:hypothetical protein